ncbi:hypothetical protein D3C87_1515030 [compost metagenome]
MRFALTFTRMAAGALIQIADTPGIAALADFNRHCGRRLFTHQIGRQCLMVFRRQMTGAEIHHHVHLTERRSLRCHPGCQETVEVIRRPAALGQSVRRDVRCHKAPQIAPLHRLAKIHLPQHAAWRMAFPAVTQRIRQVTAALPLRRIAL